MLSRVQPAASSASKTPRDGVFPLGETEAFMPSFRPFAHRALFGSYYANVFWTFIVPQKFRGFDQITLPYASR